MRLVLQFLDYTLEIWAGLLLELGAGVTESLDRFHVPAFIPEGPFLLWLKHQLLVGFDGMDTLKVA